MKFRYSGCTAELKHSWKVESWNPSGSEIMHEHEDFPCSLLYQVSVTRLSEADFGDKYMWEWRGEEQPSAEYQAVPIILFPCVIFQPFSRMFARCVRRRLLHHVRNS